MRKIRGRCISSGGRGVEKAGEIVGRIARANHCLAHRGDPARYRSFQHDSRH